MNYIVSRTTVATRFALALAFALLVVGVPFAASASQGSDGKDNIVYIGTPTDGAGAYTETEVWDSAEDTTWTVPDDVTEVKIKVWGAGGGSGYSSTDVEPAHGGAGGYAEGVISVTPGQELDIEVGAGGKAGTANSGATGGELTRVADGGTSLVVAGSGGGAGEMGVETNYGMSLGGLGGGGGGEGGGAGSEEGKDGGAGGNGATVSSGGAGGNGAGSGSSHKGGAGETRMDVTGGSGGAGHYGGGGGGGARGDTPGAEAGAGGGGSSYVISSATGIATRSGDKQVNRVGNSSDSDYTRSAGRGGADGDDGNDGLIVIHYSFGSDAGATPEPDEPEAEEEEQEEEEEDSGSSSGTERTTTVEEDEEEAEANEPEAEEEEQEEEEEDSGSSSGTERTTTVEEDEEEEEEAEASEEEEEEEVVEEDEEESVPTTVVEDAGGTTNTNPRLRTTDNLNVRATPGGELIEMVPLGTGGEKVEEESVVEGDYEWIKVRFDNGVEGYVAEPFVTEQPTTVPSDLTTEQRAAIVEQILILLERLQALQAQLDSQR